VLCSATNHATTAECSQLSKDGAETQSEKNGVTTYCVRKDRHEKKSTWQTLLKWFSIGLVGLFALAWAYLSGSRDRRIEARRIRAGLYHQTKD
jgi:hypothetical protein